jgi:DNA-binding CsgD family transcriptional regulator
MDDELNGLSETERRIVSLVAYGRTNDEVGERLILTPRTVEWSLTKICRKLRVRSRTELAAKLATHVSPSAVRRPANQLARAAVDDEPTNQGRSKR